MTLGMSEPPIEYSIVGIILAAGESKRFGPENKLLVEVDGVPILERVVKTISNRGVVETIVVTGKDHDEVTTLLSGYKLQLEHNENWRNGMGSSLAKGVEAVDESSCDGILICLGDLPYLSSEVVGELLSVFYKCGGERIVVPEANGRRGHPVIFPISYRAELVKLTGDQGAKVITREANSMIVEIKSSEILRDIDSTGDLFNPVN